MAGFEPSPATGNTFRPLQQRRAFEEIIVQVSDAVIEGRLRPGDRLPAERELAETFGVSRASVREALRALEVFGVIAARRGTGRDAGSIISEGGAHGMTNALRMHAGLLQIPMGDIVEVRAVLESYGVRRAAERREPQPALETLIEEMIEAPDVDSYHQLDTSFHVALARASGNLLLPLLMESIRSAIHRDMMTGFSALEDWRVMAARLTEDHHRILAHVVEGRPEEASVAVQAHIMAFYRDTLDSAQDLQPS